MAVSRDILSALTLVLVKDMKLVLQPVDEKVDSMERMMVDLLDLHLAAS